MKLTETRNHLGHCRLWCLCLISPEADVRPFCGGQPSSLRNACPFPILNALSYSSQGFLPLPFPFHDCSLPASMLTDDLLWATTLVQVCGCSWDFQSLPGSISVIRGSSQFCSAPELPYRGVMISVIFFSDTSLPLTSSLQHFEHPDSLFWNIFDAVFI